MAYELKICKTASLPFSRVEKHQLQSLYDTKHGRLNHKISDQSLGYKPFDGFVLVGEPAYLGITYYEPLKPKKVYLIDIDTFLNEMRTSTRKSLTEERACELATMTVIL